MPIIRWSPFGELERWFEEDWTGAGKVDFVPSLDIYQTKNDVVVEIPLAGIDPEKVDVSVENDVLTVSGKTEEKKEVREKDYYRKEIRRGSFARSVTLPVSVKGEEAKAESVNGMLKIAIPKAEKAKAKKIPVQIKKK